MRRRTRRRRGRPCWSTRAQTRAEQPQASCLARDPQQGVTGEAERRACGAPTHPAPDPAPAPAGARGAPGVPGKGLPAPRAPAAHPQGATSLPQIRQLFGLAGAPGAGPTGGAPAVHLKERRRGRGTPCLCWGRGRRKRMMLLHSSISWVAPVSPAHPSSSVYQKAPVPQGQVPPPPPPVQGQGQGVPSLGPARTGLCQTRLGWARKCLARGRRCLVGLPMG